MGKLVAYKSNPKADKGYNEAMRENREFGLPEQNKIETEAKNKPGDKEISNLNVACAHLVNYMRG